MFRETPAIGAAVLWETPGDRSSRALGNSRRSEQPCSGKLPAIGAAVFGETSAIGAPVFRETSGYRSNCDPRGVLAYTASKISGALYYIGVGKGAQRAG